MTRNVEIRRIDTIPDTARVRDYDQLSNETKTVLAAAVRTEGPVEVPPRTDLCVTDGEIVKFTCYLEISR